MMGSQRVRAMGINLARKTHKKTGSGIPTIAIQLNIPPKIRHLSFIDDRVEYVELFEIVGYKFILAKDLVIRWRSAEVGRRDIGLFTVLSQQLLQ